MNTSTKRGCAHPGCRCEVPEGEAYCSEHCRKRVESPLSSQPAECQCGHAACADHPDTQRER